MNAISKPSWNWPAEGFKFPPVRVTNGCHLTLYRVWGGASSEMGNPTRPGVCLSFEAPHTRREAEELFSVWEWGNTCSNITEFGVSAGATLFIGKVHPGDFYQSQLGPLGSQVFIETAMIRTHVRKQGSARPLKDDMGNHIVVPNRDPGKSKSS